MCCGSSGWRATGLAAGLVLSCVWLRMAFWPIAISAAGPLQAGSGPSAPSGRYPQPGDDEGDAIQTVTGIWRFQAGDDARWAAPDFDDGHWLLTPADRAWRDFGGPGANGIGWYRMRIAVPPESRLGVGLWLVRDAAEVFVDGQRVAASGDPAAADPGPAFAFQGRVPVEATADGEILIAVRVWAGLNPRTDGRISSPIVGPADAMEHYVSTLTVERWRSPDGIPKLFLGLGLAAVGLVHALIFGRRRTPEQGWFALAATLLGLHLSWQAAQAMGVLDPTWIYAHFSIFLRASAYASMVAFGACLSDWPGRTLPRLTIGFLLVAGLLGALHLADPWWRLILVAYGCAALVGFAMLVRGLRVRAPGARLLLPGFLPLLAWGLGDALDATLRLPDLYLGLRPWLTLVAIGMLTAGMSAALASRFADSLEELDDAYRASARFVPSTFLRLLGRAKITEVERGDAVALDMGVLFCDIRDFSGLVETSSPEKSFRTVNAFLAAMEPCIHRHGGFVAQYLGDGFVALFPTSGPERSEPVGAGVAMQSAMVAFNRRQVEAGEPPLRIGIGVHAGSVMLGTIGGAERMDANVISDVVNTASRVEGLCKHYGVPLMVSEAALQLDGGRAWEVQEIDEVVVKGRSSSLRVFEILDGEPDTGARDLRRSEAPAYAEALSAFRSGDLDRAEAAFADLVGYAVAGALFQERCTRLRKLGVPGDWNGVLRLDEK